MANLLKIIIHPNEILRKKSIEIKEGDIGGEEMNQLVSNMTKTMMRKEGIGLSAPQIGKNIKLIVINSEEGVLVMFNPKVVRKSWFKEWGEEGCLSVPRTFGSVKRYKKISCVYCNKKGEKNKIKAEGLLARVIQHELDHLDGVLFIDKARKIQKITKES